MGRDSATHNPSVNITQIKKGSAIKGNLRSEHSIRVDGFVAGDLISQEKIIIGQHGEIGGNLSGADITLEGQVNGDIMSNGLLQITRTAVVSGKVFAKEISIEKGAELNGEVSVGKTTDIPEMEATPVQPKEKEAPTKVLREKVAGDNFGTANW